MNAVFVMNKTERIEMKDMSRELYNSESEAMTDEFEESYYKKHRKLLQRVKDDLETLKSIGNDYAVFQSANYAAKVIKRASKDINRI